MLFHSEFYIKASNTKFTNVMHKLLNISGVAGYITRQIWESCLSVNTHTHTYINTYMNVHIRDYIRTYIVT
jgi:hypothetical protein